MCKKNKKTDHREKTHAMEKTVDSVCGDVIEAPIKCNGHACANHSPPLQRQLNMEQTIHTHTHLLREWGDRQGTERVTSHA